MKALLLIDIQNDYFADGKSPLVNAEVALDNAEAVLRQFREKRLPIIHVQHINIREGATFFIPDTEGIKIHHRLTPQEGEHVVVKNYPNSFFKTDLYEIIESCQVTELVVCGMMTHMCVDTTVRAAKDYGLPVTLVSDACATKDMQFNGATLPAAQVQTAFMAALSGMFAETVAAVDFLVE